MKVVAVIMEKGGSGKSTVSQAIAVAAALAGKRVALLDTDPNCSSSTWHDRRPEGAEFPWVVQTVSARLVKTLADARAQGIELCVIDTPPEAGTDGVTAARQADLVLIPCRTHVSDIEKLPKVRDALQLAGNPRSEIVLNDAPVQGSRHVAAADAIVQLGFAVADAMFTHRAAHADAADAGLTAMELSPGSTAADEQAALFEYVRKAVDL